MLKSDTLTLPSPSNVDVTQASGLSTTQRDVADDFDNEKGLYARVENDACDSICDNINSAIHSAASSDTAVIFSKAVRRVFLSAWTIAAKLHHKGVTVDHLLVALLTDDPNTAKKLGESSENGARVMQSGALVRLARLNKIEGEQAIKALKPEKLVVDWIKEASRFIAANSEGRELEPTDLANVLHWTDINSRTHGTLQQRLSLAKVAGGLRSQMEYIRQKIDNVNITASRHKSYTENSLRNQISGVEDKLDKLDKLSTQIANGQSDIEETYLTRTTLGIEAIKGTLDQLASQIGNSQKPIDLSQLNDQISEIKKAIGEGVMAQLPPDITELNTRVDRRTAEIRQNQLASLTGAVEISSSWLTDLEQQTSEIRAMLPQPPAGGRLFLAIVSVLALGIAGGFALNNTSTLKTAITDVVHQVRIHR